MCSFSVNLLFSKSGSNGRMSIAGYLPKDRRTVRYRYRLTG